MLSPYSHFVKLPGIRFSVWHAIHLKALCLAFGFQFSGDASKYSKLTRKVSAFAGTNNSSVQIPPGPKV